MAAFRRRTAAWFRLQRQNFKRRRNEKRAANEARQLKSSHHLRGWIVWGFALLSAIALLIILPEVARNIVLGGLLGLVLIAIALGLMTPLIIKDLVNGPVGNKKSGIHFFTYPEEGKVKLIVRGDNLIRMIMLYAGHRFARADSGQDKNHPEYWEIVPTEQDEKSENPLAGIHPLLYPWAYYVYVTTGAVFTGIYPFQTVREYTLERTKMRRVENTQNENSDASQVLQGANIFLEVIEDISDHFRAREFLYPFRVAAADTKDKIPVNVLGVLKSHVSNPHRAAYGTDRWDHQLVNLATNATTNFTRAKNLDAVLTTEDETTAKELNLAIENIRDEELKYGFHLDGVDIIDISPNLKDEDREKLYAEALAKSVGQATIIDGKSRAEALRAINEANEAGGEFALETMRAEALVRAAAAVKNGTVILNAGGATSGDPTQAAILAELQKLNKGKADA